MHKTSIGALALAACLGLSACNSSGGVGEMSQGETAGTGLGAVGGGLIGNRLSNALDGSDQQAAAQAAARAAESTTGETIPWRKTNAIFQTTASGYAQAQGALFTDASGRTCRYIKETIIKDNQQTSDTVKLCKGPNGWVAG